MDIHIQDEETAKAVLEFARRRGLDVSAAIRAAIEEADAATNEEYGKVPGIEPVLERARVRRKELGIPLGATFDLKAFRDEIWGEAG
ncbi:MAG: hypothetical protein ACK4U0_09810 [Mesorhizobium sp.]